MKKFFLFLIILLSSLNSYAIEDVVLDTEENKFNLDYLSDVYYGKIENEKEISPVLRIFSQKGLTFDDSFINSVRIRFLYSDSLSVSKTKHDDTHTLYRFDCIEPMLSVKFNEDKSEFFFDYCISRRLKTYPNNFTEKISQLYVSHNINENQKILFGQGPRLPNSYDGANSTIGREMVLKSQLGRNFGELLSVGVRNIANYKYINYDVGVYDSTRFMRDFGNGLDFTGSLMIKPLEDIKEKTGELKIGTGYNIGKNNISYNSYSFYTGYDYKKFHMHGEFMHANGYNSIVESNNNADGYYILSSYDITPKISLVGRYDYFIANNSHKNSYCQEYSAGITYKIFTNMKFMLNYVKRNYSNSPDSNMFLFATRFII